MMAIYDIAADDLEALVRLAHREVTESIFASLVRDDDPDGMELVVTMTGNCECGWKAPRANTADPTSEGRAGAHRDHVEELVRSAVTRGDLWPLGMPTT